MLDEEYPWTPEEAIKFSKTIIRYINILMRDEPDYPVRRIERNIQKRWFDKTRKEEK